MLNRRHLLQPLPLLPLLAAVPWRPAHAAPDERLALHALNRLGYGPRPGDLAAWGAQPWEVLVETQLAAAQPLPEALRQRLAERAPAPLTGRITAYREAERKRDAEGAENERRELARAAMLEAAEARLARALWSPNQLEERLVEFWFNHFNVFIGKGPVRVLVGDYEAQAIRPHVLGRFRDLLGATARHPAMLIYLDNAQSGASRGGRGGLNENYARELMELHTLGVDGGYTQQDVTELARVLTGWSIEPQDGSFRFMARRHDDAAKTWLGQAVPGRGQAQGEWALDRLAEHPATAQRIAFKLAQHFVADAPEPALVQATAQAFLRSGGDLRATTRTLLLHPLARSEAVFGQQFRSPYRYVLALLRAADVPVVNDWQPVLQALRQLGQPLFGCVTPDGYRVTREAWLDPESLLRRAETATRLAQRVRPDPERLLTALGPALSPATRALVASEPAARQAALLLAAPDLQNA
ncbi:MAG: DUF1800 domain-containing protein [Burkholderiales bacterium]|nr:DUF1800 domain-containing protein [Burkholderiales bacterium]